MEQWINWLRNETWPLAKGLSAYVFGHLAYPGESEYTFISNELKENLKSLNNSLKSKNWLVGDDITAADLCLALTVLELYQCVMDTNLRNSINNLNAHFKRTTEHPVFKARCGAIKLGKKQVLPAAMTSVKEEKVKVAKGKGKK